MEQQPVETTVYSLSDGPPPEASERREGERHLTLYRVGSMMVDGRQELCLIKNISCGGMRIRAYSPIREEAAVSIELKCGVPIEGRVGWVKGNDAGIVFARPIDVLDILSASTHGPRPRMPRIEIDRSVTLREGANQYRVAACDISQGGLKVRCETILARGSDVVATLPGLSPIPGVVCWNDGDFTGIAFNTPLSLETLVGWVRHRQERARAAS